MATVGSLIKKSLQKVGTSYTILRDSGNITGERASIKLNAQSKPFIREFFLEAMLAYDSQVVEGDVIQLQDGRVFLVMNKTPEGFKDAIYSFSGVFYKCNVTGSIFRPAQSVAGYRSSTAWTLVKAGVRALQTESFYGNMLEPDVEIGMLGRETHDLYLPHALGLLEHDRWSLSTVAFVSKTTGRTTDATKAITAGPSPVSDTWTVRFSNATDYIVTGAKVGQVPGEPKVATLYSAGYFSIPAGFFTGTWAVGNTYVFTTAAEFYEVTETKTRRFPAVDLAQLGNDTR